MEQRDVNEEYHVGSAHNANSHCSPDGCFLKGKAWHSVAICQGASWDMSHCNFIITN